MSKSRMLINTTAIFLSILILLVSACRHNNVQDSQEDQSVDENIKPLEERIEKLVEENNDLKKDLSRCKESRDDDYENRRKRGNELQQLIWELQLRSMANKEQRKEINKELKEIWPLIEKEMPYWVDMWEEAVPGFGPDGFISKIYEPKTFEESGYELQEEGPTHQSFAGDDDDGVRFNSFCSPDRKKCVDGPCFYECDDWSAVFFYNLETNMMDQLQWCVTSCDFLDIAWIDNERFVVIKMEYDPKVVHTIYIFMISKEYPIQLIEKHEGSGIESSRLNFKKFSENQEKRLKRLGFDFSVNEYQGW